MTFAPRPSRPAAALASLATLMLAMAAAALQPAGADTYRVYSATVASFAPQPGRPRIDFLLSSLTNQGIEWSTWDRATGQWTRQAANYPQQSYPSTYWQPHYPMVTWFDGDARANAFYSDDEVGAPWWTSAGLQLHPDIHPAVSDRHGSVFVPDSGVLRQTNRAYLHFFGRTIGDRDCGGIGLREYWWNADLSQWTWTYHGCPRGRGVALGQQSAVSTRQYGAAGYVPGLPVHTFVFLVDLDGSDRRVWVRHVSVEGVPVPWGWLPLGAPADTTELNDQPLALSYDRGGGVWRTHVFVTARSNGDGRFHLYEKFVDTGVNSADWTRFSTNWVDHGSPPGLDAASGAEGRFAMPTGVVRRPGGSLRIGLYGSSQEGPYLNSGGQLVERHWNGSAWVWAVPDRSPQRGADGAPVPMRVVSSAAGSNGQHVKIFSISDDGVLWERRWDTAGNWSWHRH